MSPRHINMDLGVQVNMPRRHGHSHLGLVILSEFPEAMLVVPNDSAFRMAARNAPHVQDRVVISRHLEVEQKRILMERLIEPFDKASICIVDGASIISQWELEPIRCADWDRYVELS